MTKPPFELPLRIASNDSYPEIRDKDSMIIIAAGEFSRDEAAHLVLAVNSFGPLVGAATELLKMKKLMAVTVVAITEVENLERLLSSINKP